MTVMDFSSCQMAAECPASLAPQQPEGRCTGALGSEAWDARFSRREASGAPGKDWYCGWGDLQASLRPLIACTDRVLLPGCGDAPLAMDIYKCGFTRLTCVDFAASAVARLHASFAALGEAAEEVAFLVEDVTAMSSPAGSFDAVLDKGCFDALAIEDSSAYLAEVYRVLRPGGRFACVTNCARLLRQEVQRATCGWCEVRGAGARTAYTPAAVLPLGTAVLGGWAAPPGMQADPEPAVELIVFTAGPPPDTCPPQAAARAASHTCPSATVATAAEAPCEMDMID